MSLKPPGFKPSTLSSENPVSKFGFFQILNWYRYASGAAGAVGLCKLNQVDP
jgi:hypothetical protein